ncbi:NIF system FeS cluster assembly, NifU, N-terminal [Acididesulfobacillus acetoxydans]|uniref:NIF system FeS cluster assembly, NifU, N-terminal n=1 Tax=Acididesulfobacillus acetoxydans TaxID=1561005 RepID=A0A8S0X594_9FIRM|nr:iron-sulfur cluster assembly scaffold protein [Acididesulfobacillus acetoxydans]CAA7601450.1 NIF system FeS cluster assembly, NifU, N-terminal [Acididesulfobacillus acetoxydans]CAA7603293.1 NIF system FeS cluster assembly, NifU, N-terminal [Acididesulfobacillus acetoxydans]
MPTGIYTDKVLDHFICPRNVGRMNNADGESTIGDPSCGDSVTVYLKVRDGRIEAISYLVFGCAGAISTSSVTSELAKGKALEEALEITDDDVIEALGGLPERKKHCSLLAVKGLRGAIEDYYRKMNEAGE